MKELINIVIIGIIAILISKQMTINPITSYQLKLTKIPSSMKPAVANQEKAIQFKEPIRNWNEITNDFRGRLWVT